MRTYEKIRYYRKLRGLSQAELALLLQWLFPGIDKTGISKIENDKRVLRVSDLRIIAEVLGCEQADLVDEPS